MQPYLRKFLEDVLRQNKKECRIYKNDRYTPGIQGDKLIIASKDSEINQSNQNKKPIYFKNVNKKKNGDYKQQVKLVRKKLDITDKGKKIHFFRKENKGI